jgi:hypothetical protein
MKRVQERDQRNRANQAVAPRWKLYRRYYSHQERHQIYDDNHTEQIQQKFPTADLCINSSG